MMCMIYVIVLKYVTQCNEDVCVDDYHLLFLLSVRPITVVKGIVGQKKASSPASSLDFLFSLESIEMVLLIAQYMHHISYKCILPSSGYRLDETLYSGRGGRRSGLHMGSCQSR